MIERYNRVMCVSGICNMQDKPTLCAAKVTLMVCCLDLASLVSNTKPSISRNTLYSHTHTNNTQIIIIYTSHHHM